MFFFNQTVCFIDDYKCETREFGSEEFKRLKGEERTCAIFRHSFLSNLVHVESWFILF